MEFQHITFEKRDGVARLTLSEPPLNVLDIAMMREINAALDGLEDDPSVRVLVIDAVEGSKAFSAGVDVSEHTAEKVEEIGNVDVLLLPVGGVSTINAVMAAEAVRQLEPKVVVPMHYKTPALAWELEPVERFFKEIGVTQINSQAKLTLNKASLPATSQVFLLEY